MHAGILYNITMNMIILIIVIAITIIIIVTTIIIAIIIIISVIAIKLWVRFRAAGIPVTRCRTPYIHIIIIE